MKTRTMLKLEELHGQQIDALLIEHYERYGSQSKVAQELGISQSVLSEWLPRLGLKQHAILVKE